MIFKNSTNGEVEKEISTLEEKGVDKNNITHFDFPWKDITDFKSVCEMTVDAIKTLEAADKANQKIFFHCTVGEDRTGYLAGLYRIYSQNISTDEVFQKELCARGYEAGDPRKVINVVMKIRETLTPSFLTMVDIINDAKKNKKILSKKLCTQDNFNNYNATILKKYTCARTN